MCRYKGSGNTGYRSSPQWNHGEACLCKGRGQTDPHHASSRSRSRQSQRKCSFGLRLQGRSRKGIDCLEIGIILVIANLLSCSRSHEKDFLFFAVVVRLARRRRVGGGDDLCRRHLLLSQSLVRGDSRPARAMSWKPETPAPFGDGCPLGTRLSLTGRLPPCSGYFSTSSGRSRTSRPARKSANACSISSRVFMTKGPC